MTAQVIPFAFQEHHSVRVVMIDDEPWFVAADIAAALDYSEAVKLTRMLESDEKGLHIVETLGGNQEVSVISEPGLYRALANSRSSKAKPFQRWLFHDVLPTLRRRGHYETPGARPEPFLVMTQSECAAFFERCITRAIRAAIGAPRARRVKFSDAEKADMLRLREQGMGVAEIARRLNRSAGSVGNFLLQYRRNVSRSSIN